LAKISNIKYLDSAGNTVRLAQLINKGGAAGSIYEVSGKSDLVAKIFHKSTNQLHDFVKEMVSDYKNGLVDIELAWGNNIKTNLGTWPIEVIYDDKKQFKGYLMPKAHGIELQEVIYRPSRDPNYKHFAQVKNKLNLAYRLAVVFSNFYKSGNYTNGDIKPQNIIVDDKGFPMILDLDNLTINKPSKKLVNKGKNPGTPNYQAHDYKDDIYSDYFSIAVIFYELIFGIHPYAGSSKDDSIIETQMKINHRMFVHGRKKSSFHVIPPPHDAFNTTINKKIQTLFHRAFNIDDPSKRPNMQEWSLALHEFISSKSKFQPTYQPNQKNIKPKKKRNYSGSSSSGLFGSSGAAASPSKTLPAFNQQRFNNIRLEYIFVCLLLIPIPVFYCAYTQDNWVYLSLAVFAFVSYYRSVNKRSKRHFGMSWGDVWKKHNSSTSWNIGKNQSLTASPVNTQSKTTIKVLYIAFFVIALAVNIGFVIVYEPQYKDHSWLYGWGITSSGIVAFFFFLFRGFNLLGRGSLFFFFTLCVGMGSIEYMQVKPPSALKQAAACKCLNDGPGFSEMSSTPFDDLSQINQRLRRKCSEVFNPGWNSNIHDIIAGAKIAIKEARFIEKYFGCNGSITNTRNGTFAEFYAWRKEKSLVQKDFIFKGGFLTYPHAGNNYTDSLIIIGPSNNSNRQFLIEVGTDYYTVYDNTWNTANREIYLKLDEVGYKEIQNRKSQTWTIPRIGLGDNLRIRGSDITYHQENTQYGVYFIQNTLTDYNKFILNKFEKKRGREEFISADNYNILFPWDLVSTGVEEDTEETRKATITKFFENKKAETLYIKLLSSNERVSEYTYEVPITFIAMDGTTHLYWLYNVHITNGDIQTWRHMNTLNKDQYNQLAKQ